MPGKIIFLVDMDKFFVAVEQLHQPWLRGKPVAVGGGRDGGGIIVTASYEARKYGIRAGMNTPDARKLCPHLIFVSSSPSKYLDASRKVIAALMEFTDRVEPVSVDEAFMDVTDAAKAWGGVEQLGLKVKRRVFEATGGLTASIGAGANRLVAKMASELQKPDGFTYVPPERVAEVFRTIPIGDLYGVGRATEKVLRSFGIRTVGDLAVFPADILQRRFGKIGRELVQIARGQGSELIQTPDELPAEKSMGHAYTFRHDITDPDMISGSLHLLCERVARRLRAKHRAGSVVTITLRYHGMETKIHGHKLRRNVDQEMDIFAAATELLRQIYEPPRPVRLLGVSVSELCSTDTIRQQELFHPRTDPNTVAAVYDEIRSRFGINSIGYASGLLSSSHGSLKPHTGTSAHVISVGFRPFYSTI